MRTKLGGNWIDLKASLRRVLKVFFHFQPHLPCSSSQILPLCFDSLLRRSKDESWSQQFSSCNKHSLYDILSVL
ncbi:hypothetical protein SDJN03_20636, partial [Cucurbita argyrosperma subsp. sororia]